jgi:hypothetical protein
MIRFAWFPEARSVPEWGERVVGVFRDHEADIASGAHPLTGNEVLAVLADELRREGFVIERRQLPKPKLSSSEFYGADGSLLVRHHFDVFHPEWLCCLAIEADPGKPEGLAASEFVEPLLVVDMDTLCLAVPNTARVHAGAGAPSAASFDGTRELAESVYGHSRVPLPYRLLLIGY